MWFARLQHLVSELEHRRVFRVAGLYAVAAWAAVQVAATVFPVLALPTWTVRLVVVCAILGFPVAVALAWAFDLQVTAAKAADTAGDAGAPAAAPREHASGGRWFRRAVAVLLVAMVGAGGWAGWRSTRTAAASRTPVSPALVAVLPFDVQAGSEQNYLRDGMVSLLSARLDGAGGLRSVDSQTLLRSAAPEGGVAPDAARQVASRFGAGLFVVGSLVGAGTHIQVAASLYETDHGGQPMATASAEGPADSVFSLVDRIAIQLLSTRAGPDAGMGRTAALTTASLPALKAYLEGERAYRRGQWGLAVDAFSRATAADTSFALAYFRLAEAAGWNGDLALADSASAAAGRHGARLSPRYRQLFAAQAAFRRDDPAAEPRYRAILENYPQDAEAWYGLGDALYHHNHLRGRSQREAREPLERALALDPGNDGYLVHLRELACRDGRLGDLPRLTPPGPPVDSLNPLLNGNLAALGGGPAELRRVMDRLAAAGQDEFGRTVGLALGCAPPEVLPALFSLTERRAAQSGTAEPGWLWFGSGLEAVRGRWAAALAMIRPLRASNPVGEVMRRSALLLDPLSVPDPAELRRARADLLALQLPRVATNPDGSADSLDDRPELRLYRAGFLSLRLGETAVAADFASRLERLPPATPYARAEAPILVAILRAYTLAAEGRREEALRVLEDLDTRRLVRKLPTGPDSYSAMRPHWLRAELLRELGREREALAWYVVVDEESWSYSHLAPAQLRLAQLRERFGDRREAARNYRRFIALWHDADPQVQPLVADAQRHLAALER